MEEVFPDGGEARRQSDELMSMLALEVPPRSASKAISVVEKLLPLPAFLAHCKRMKSVVAADASKVLLLLLGSCEDVRRSVDDGSLQRLVLQEVLPGSAQSAVRWIAGADEASAVVGRAQRGDVCKDIVRVRVPRWPPQSRAEFARLKREWPVVFHPQTCEEEKRRAMALSESEIRQAEGFMMEAIADARALRLRLEGADHDRKVGVVLVDPATGREVLRRSRCEDRDMRHPLRTAVMVTLEGMGTILRAQTQRRLDSGVRSKRKRNEALEGQLAWEARKRSRQTEAAVPKEAEKSEIVNENRQVVPNDVLEDALDALANTQQYLCTGLDVYLTHEPELLSAMALLHNRVRRVFWALDNPDQGGLYSRQRLHANKNLNHHFRAFRNLCRDAAVEAFGELRAAKKR